MIVARGVGQGGEEMVATAGYGIGSGGAGPGPSTPLPYGRDWTVRVMRDDIVSAARRDEQIDR